MKNRRIGPPHDGSKPPRNRWYDISLWRILLLVAVGVALMWVMGAFR